MTVPSATRNSSNVDNGVFVAAVPTIPAIEPFSLNSGKDCCLLIFQALQRSPGEEGTSLLQSYFFLITAQ